MVKTSLPFLLVALCLFLSPQAQGFSLYAGTGDAYAWPKVFHLRISSVELIDHPGLLAIAQSTDRAPYYINFGAGMASQGTTDFGLVAGVGYHNPFWKILGFRIDWTTFAGFKSYMMSQVSLGLTLNF